MLTTLLVCGVSVVLAQKSEPTDETIVFTPQWMAQAQFAGYYVATTDDLLVTALLIIPHGIFEFSSCILACASGFVLFNFLFKFLKTLHGQDDGPVKELLSNSFDESADKLKQAIILLVIASILMAIAGFVEVYMTIHIAEFILNFI